MYAVVESGGKQYRVEQGSVLLVDRLQAKEGDKVSLKPVMVRDKEALVTPEAVGKVKVEAKVTGHVRGEKIKVFKYKAKKGYSRRAGHRAELTELEVVSIGTGTARKAPAKKAAGEKGETSAAAKKATSASAKSAGTKSTAKKTSTAGKPSGTKASTGKTATTKKPATGKTAAAKKPASPKAKTTTKKAVSKKKPTSDKSSGKETQDGS